MGYIFIDIYLFGLQTRPLYKIVGFFLFKYLFTYILQYC